MVLDALGAFALACNVLQAVEYGAKIPSKAVEYGKSESGLLVEHQALETITIDLMSITKELASVSNSQEPGNAAEVLMHKANTECMLISQSFLAFLNRFKMNGNPALWKRVGAAMRLAWSKEKMNSMMKALAEARSNLSFAFLIFSHSRLEQLVTASSSAVEEKLIAAIQQIAIDNQSEQAHVGELSSRLQVLDLDEDDQSLQDERVTITKTCRKSLGSVSDVYIAISCDANSQRNINYNHDVLCRRRNDLESLFFPEMDDRFFHISDAHSDTFAWMLIPSERHNQESLSHWFESDDEKNATFWISGKPGFGKSTLLRYVCRNVAASYFMANGSSQRRLVVIKHFFWKPGHPLQRSLEGMLRSLTFQLLQEDPSALDNISQEHDQASFGDDLLFSQTQWTIPLLKAVANRLVSRLLVSSSLIIFLDGLDELGNNDRDRNELLIFLRSLPQSKYLKMMCSSRPWVMFEDHFAGAPQIRLEDLTKDDIRSYVHDKLYDDVHFQRSCLNDMNAVKDLISDIVKDAQGVFLWVYLVVQELLTGAQRGENTRMLRSRFNSIPRDLTEYFRKIMENIEPGYAQEASSFLQIQLSYAKTIFEDGIECRQPRLLELSFLDLNRLDFAWDPTFNPGFSMKKFNDRATVQDLMKRRVNSRCMGLLEVRNDHSRSDANPSMSMLGSRLEFFHRSFADFLSEEADEILYKYTNGGFDTSLYRLNAHLVLVKDWGVEHCSLLNEISFPIVHEAARVINKYPYLTNGVVGVVSQLTERWSRGWNWDPPSSSVMQSLGFPTKLSQAIFRQGSVDAHLYDTNTIEASMPWKRDGLKRKSPVEGNEELRAKRLRRFGT